VNDASQLSKGRLLLNALKRRAAAKAKINEKANTIIPKVRINSIFIHHHLLAHMPKCFTAPVEAIAICLIAG